jgi:hypothetical protein
VFVIESLGRAPNGKLDHQRLRQLACDRVTIAAQLSPPAGR